MYSTTMQPRWLAQETGRQPIREKLGRVLAECKLEAELVVLGASSENFFEIVSMMRPIMCKMSIKASSAAFILKKRRCSVASTFPRGGLILSFLALGLEALGKINLLTVMLLVWRKF